MLAEPRIPAETVGPLSPFGPSLLRRMTRARCGIAFAPELGMRSIGCVRKRRVGSQENPSAHASGSYAARTLAEKIFGKGRRHHVTLSHPGIPDVTLHYTKFSQMTDDIDDARVYGGIPFRFDQEAGAPQGRAAGPFVFQPKLPLSP